MRSSAGMSATRAMRAMPGLPGAACSSGSRGLAARVSTRACSRPPPPTTITFTPLGPDPLYYRLVALRPDADHAQGSPDLGLHEPDEILRGLRKVPAHPAPGYVHSPAGELLVDRLGVVEVGLAHGELLYPLALYLVADADLYLIDRRKHVQELYGEVRDPVEGGGVLNAHQVQPPAPPRPAGRAPVLVARPPDDLAGLVRELGREGPVSHPGRVRLGHPDNPIHRPRRDAAPHHSPADGRVRGRNERVGAVVVVQERRLCPLQQNRLSCLQGLAQQRTGVGHHGLEQFPEREKVLCELARVVGLLAIDVLEDGVLLA